MSGELDDKDFLCLEYIGKRKTIRRIAKEINSYYAMVRNRLIKHEIPIRNASESRLGVKRKPHTEETKQKMREIALRQNKESIKKAHKASLMVICGNKYRLGKYHTKESKEKMSKARLGKKTSRETRLKMREASLGAKAYNWKGGYENKYSAIRKSCMYRMWREQVFERDNYMCVLCNYKRRDINAHHILAFVDFPEHRFDPDNGITLCEYHHKIFHNKRMFREMYLSEFELQGGLS